MNEEHVKDLLSAHMDDALSDVQRRRVSDHLGACAECRAELEDLRRLAKLLASVPYRELPPGFLARLKARQAEAARGTPWLSLALSPGTRMAAYGLTGLLVGLVFFREVRYRLAPAMLGDDGSLERAEPGTAEEAEDVARLLESRRRAAKSREWRGVVQGDAAAPAEPAGGSAAPAAPAPARLQGEGAPVGRSAHTNESIHAFLETEKKRMGIRGVAPREDSKDDPWEGVPNRPLDREEAMQAMRRMTSQLTRINEQARWKRAPTVPLAGGTPRVLGTRDPARPLAVPTAGAAPAPGAGSVALAGDGRGLGFQAAGDDSGPALKAAKARPLPLRNGWSGRTGGMDSPGGAVIKLDEHWTDLWERVRFAESRPSLDFKRDMAVAVFGGPSEGRSVRITGVANEGGRLVIRYRMADGESGPTSPYHIVIVPRSDLPFAFQQVP